MFSGKGSGILVHQIDGLKRILVATQLFIIILRRIACMPSLSFSCRT